MIATVNETELHDLVQQLRDGNDSVSERIIVHFLGLARSLSRHAVASHPEKTDDIHAVAVFWVVQAVHWVPSHMYDNNIGAYINSTVKLGIREYLQRDHIIRIPKDAWNSMVAALELDELDDFHQLKALKELKRISMVFQASIPDPGGGFLADFVKPEWTDNINRKEELAVCRFDVNYLIADDIRYYLNLNDYEEQILDMRIKGYTLQEIGASLKRTHPAIIKTLRKLQERYRTIQRAHPTLPEPP